MRLIKKVIKEEGKVCKGQYRRREWMVYEVNKEEGKVEGALNLKKKER